MNYNMMTSTSRPPFYWKVPAPEKDYMYENVQRIRKTAAQNRFRGSEPMKASFIPGVTKNAKYAHVTSRVGELLRSNAERGDEGAFDAPNNSRTSKLYSSSSASKLPNKFSQSQKQVSYHGQPQRGGGGGGVPGMGIGGRGEDGGGFVNPRLSRSSTDLSSMTKKKTGNLKGVSSAPAPQGHPSKMSCEGPGNYVPRAKRKPRGLQAEDESVYNWRFSEGPGNVNSNHSFPHSGDGSNNIKHFHRVEYLPCDGICADETVMEDRGGDGGGGDGSGRSSSRTSRGMNTDETRIIEDLQHLEIQQPQQRHMPPHGGSGGGGGGGRSQSLERLGRNQIQGQQGQGQGSGPRREVSNWMEPQDFEEEVDRNGDGGYEDDDIGDLGGSHVTFHQNLYHHPQHHPTQNQRNASTATATTNTVMKNNYGGGGGGGGRGVGVGSGRGANPSVSSTDLPHTLGTVPKYLKQRQEEWKCEADKINAAAAYNADVPPGHVLLSEEERIETLTGLKSKYSMLIDELNRVPIRIDTMRVREYKIQLEQQLQKLERGMAIFSRSRVYVKLPDAGPGAGSGPGPGSGGGTGGASRTGGMSSHHQAPSKVSA